jgi:hypothetical protein
MKFMLSDEIQTGDMSDLYPIENPVNQRAAEKRMALIREQTESISEEVKAGNRIIISKHDPDDYMNQIDRYLDIYTRLRDALTTPIIGDPVLKDSILSAIENMSGRAFNADEVRAELTRIVDVYMSEEGGDIQSGYKVIYITAAVAAIGGAAVGIVVTVRKHKKAKSL